VWIGFDCLRTGTGGGRCGDEPSGSCATELVTYIYIYIFWSDYTILVLLIQFVALEAKLSPVHY
jgi:hypothetical protein